MAWWRTEYVHIIENECYCAILPAICKTSIFILGIFAAIGKYWLTLIADSLA